MLVSSAEHGKRACGEDTSRPLEYDIGFTPQGLF